VELKMTNKSRFLGRVGVLLLGSAALVALLTPGLANGFGESRAWQFDTTADKVNRAMF
jgi:hypothetical protein